MSETLGQPKALEQVPTDPITAVGIVASQSKAPDGYYVVSNRFSKAILKHVVVYMRFSI